MKKLITMMVAITMIFASCSKERKLNKRLDGDWSVVTVDGKGLDVGESMTYSFNKDNKDNGTFTLIWVDATYGSESFSGTYILNKDEVITITYSFFGDVETLTVIDSSKEDMTLKSSDGEVVVLKKK